MLEKTLESLLDSEKIKPVDPKGDQPEYSLQGLMLSWISNTLATWSEEPAHLKRPLCWEDWGQVEKSVAEDEIFKQHHQLDGDESEQTPGNSEGQRSLGYCCPGVAKRWTRLSNWTTANQPSLTKCLTNCIPSKLHLASTKYRKTLLDLLYRWHFWQMDHYRNGCLRYFLEIES